MSVAIWKYEIPIEDEFMLLLPATAVVLSVQVQRGVPVLWAVVESGHALIPRKFQLQGTGQPLGKCGPFIGTFQLESYRGVDNLGLVYHLFHSQENE